MKVLIGMDGGGTKTDIIMLQPDGSVVARTRTGASSLTGRTPSEVSANLKSGFDAIHADQYDIAAVYIGASGCGLGANSEQVGSIIRTLLPGDYPMRVTSDLFNALSTGVGTGDGVIAIAGTGSSVMVRHKGLTQGFGGWGYIVGDEGSGFDISRRAFNAIARYEDGLIPPTMLYDLHIKAYGMTLRQRLTHYYADDTKRRIAEFAPQVFAAAAAGDAAALSAVRESISGFVDCIRAAAQIGGYNIVVGGSLWQNELYSSEISAALGTEYHFIRPKYDPIFGAALEAAQTAGIPVTDEFMNNVTRGL